MIYLEYIQNLLKQVRIPYVMFFWDTLICSLSFPFAHHLLFVEWPPLKQIIVFYLVSLGTFLYIRSWRGDRRCLRLDEIPILIAGAAGVNVIFYPLALLMSYPHPMISFLSAITAIVFLPIPRFLDHIMRTKLNDQASLSRNGKNELLSALYLSDAFDLLAILEEKSQDSSFPYMIIGYCSRALPHQAIKKWKYYGHPENIGLILENLRIMDEMPQRLLIERDLLSSDVFRQKIIEVKKHGVSLLVTDGGLKNIRLLTEEDLIGWAFLPSIKSQTIKELTDETIAIISSGKPLTLSILEWLIPLNPQKIIVIDSCEMTLAESHRLLREKRTFESSELILSRRDSASCVEHLLKNQEVTTLLYLAGVWSPTLAEENPLCAFESTIEIPLRILEVAAEKSIQRVMLLSCNQTQQAATFLDGLRLLLQLCVAKLQSEYKKTHFLIVQTPEIFDDLRSDTFGLPYLVRSGRPLRLPREGNSSLITRRDVTEYIGNLIFRPLPKEKNLCYSIQGSSVTGLADLSKSLIRFHGLEPNKDLMIYEFSQGMTIGMATQSVSVQKEEGIESPFPGVMLYKMPKIPDRIVTRMVSDMTKAVNISNTTRLIALTFELIQEYNQISLKENEKGSKKTVETIKAETAEKTPQLTQETLAQISETPIDSLTKVG